MANNNDSQEAESPIKFPCDFTIKVMGASNHIFEKKVLNIIRRHFPDFDKDKISRRHSKDHNYLALSISIYVDNKGQLDSLYQDLNSAAEVLMVL